MPVSKRTFRSYHPAFGKFTPGKNDRMRSLTLNLGTLSATTTKDIFRAPAEALLRIVSFVVTTTVAANNTDYWDFDLINASKGSVSVFTQTGQTAPDTRAASLNGLTANTPADLYTDVGTEAVPPNQANGSSYFLAPNDVLQIVATKHASGANLVGVLVQLEYEISGVTTTTSTSTTTTTTTSTSTSTTTTTTTTTTTSTTTTIT